MAEVWLAQHGERVRKLVAVKTILPRYATDLRFQQMFLDEARIAAGIEHPNVAQIFDVGEHGDLLYLVMEWVDGESLSKLLRAHVRLPPGIAARICADACAGLHAAHELTDKDGRLLNVIHRDVSPQNILISVKGSVKLIDFGIAKPRDRAQRENSNVKGKILYMAPEQAVGALIDRRADVWAIGAILYHALGGSPAYGADSQLATLQLLTDPSMQFKPLPSDVPEPLRAVVGLVLVRDPSQRISTAKDLGAAIERAMRTAKIQTSSRDVAKYVALHLIQHNDARSKAVELALQAAKLRSSSRPRKTRR